MKRNSFDEERRRREREARAGRESGLAVDTRKLSDMLRSGEVSRARVVLAGVLGYEPAAAAAGVRPNPVLSAGFGRDDARWVRVLLAASTRETGSDVALWLAAFSAFYRFDLMERPGFSVSIERSRLGYTFDRVLDAVDEARAIARGVGGIVQAALDGRRAASWANELRLLGDRVNELWEEARHLDEAGDLDQTGVEELWNVASRLFILVSVVRTRSARSSLLMASDLIDGAVRIWTRGDVVNDDDAAEVAERVLNQMIIELLPGFRRS
jgi:hypothetical protein